MDHDDLVRRVRALREKGSSSKEIARALGMKPAAVVPIVRAIAAADQASLEASPEQRTVDCWVSPGWSDGLTVDGHPEWIDIDDPGSGTSGLVALVVARDTGRSRVRVCGYLVDVYCLGVKNTIGPRVMDQHGLAEFARTFFSMYPAQPLAVPVELARHLVFGAVEYARTLGFEPARGSDFDKTRNHLGQWTGPSAITFGKDGKPLYIQGPHDNPNRVMRTLERSIGAGNYDYLITV
ncbi:MAG TPA: hypothetical protein VLJ59_19045 [Mycobacteriales bacterium]|nr:hypothetical protein [Mycobacteriales bacterium]